MTDLHSRRVEAAARAAYESHRGQPKKWTFETCDEVTKIYWRDRISAALAAADTVVGTGWRPIETAPKDGTWFLGLRGEQVQKTQRGKTSHVPLNGWCFIRDWDREDPDYDLWEPTHWMPLPEAPVRDLEEGK